MILVHPRQFFIQWNCAKKNQAFSKSNLSDGYAAGFEICTVCCVGHAIDLIIEEKVWVENEQSLVVFLFVAVANDVHGLMQGRTKMKQPKKWAMAKSVQEKPDSVVLQNGLLSEEDDYGTTCCHNCSRVPDELIKSFLIASKLKYCLGRKNVPQNTIYFVSLAFKECESSGYH